MKKLSLVALVCIFSLISGAVLAQIEDITVTSQRVEQSVQTVPIAVTALDSESLKLYQIEGFSDLQFNIPNVTYSKVNFTGNNFQIRGIGTTLVTATADNGVGININDVPLNSPRLFETEYYDIDRIEILRGPQGTLFGRNATAGVVNMHTAKPIMDEWSGHGEFEYGNYNSKRVEAMLNIPLGEKVAIRLAGNFIKRDGYTTDINSGDDLDGRDSYSLRGSVRLKPTDRTTIDFMVSWFDENSNRTRAQKQMCDYDPTAVLGCSPDKLEFETANINSTLGGILRSNLVLGEYGASNFFDNHQVIGDNPADLRETRRNYDPVYRADELLITMQIEQEISDSLTLTVTGGYQDTGVASRQEYFSFYTENPTVPQAVYDDFPITSAMFPDGLFPLSDIDPDNQGVIGGHVDSYNTGMPSYDLSANSVEQYTGEVRLNSDFDGPLNFMLGGFYMKFKSDFDYYVASSTLDYFALLGSRTDGIGLVSPFYNSETDAYNLESWAIFGEAYYAFTDDLVLTAGLRYTHDEKTAISRQILFNTISVLGADEPLSPQPDYRTDEGSWGEVTGRAVLTWMPTDNQMYYGSYSRGYKGGGFNPPSFSGAYDDRFDPEFIDAYEVGTKLNFADNTAQANLAGFYYNYGGLQVSKIIDRTSVNENIDAKIWGLEAELLWQPSINWAFNMSGSYMGSNIRNASLVDGRDPSNANPDIDNIKDYTNASNCVVMNNGAPSLIGSEVLPLGAFGDCFGVGSLDEQLATINERDGTNYQVSDGEEVDLSGNSIQQAPEFTMNVGAQYTHYFGNGMSMAMRADYYYQTAMFARIFNKPVDRIDSWGVLNAQVTLTSSNEDWYVRAFIQNIANSEPVVGQYFTDPSSGNFTNVFVLEPRRFGIEIGADF